MSSNADGTRPPRLAVWLLNLFVPAAGESMLGDLFEEYNFLASKSEPALAKIWFWRQTAKTIPHLLVAGFVAAPWSTSAIVIMGFVLMRLAFKLPEETILSVLYKCRVCEYHFDACQFWISDGILIGLIVLNALVGGLVAILAKSREMIVTTMLALLRIVLLVAGLVTMVARTGHYWFSGGLLNALAFAMAPVLGGAIIRICRQAVTHRSAFLEPDQ